MGDPERVSVAEIAALTARLWALSQAGRDADEQERAQFIADKEQLLARIEADQPDPADLVDPGSRATEAHRDDGFDDGDCEWGAS